MLILPLCICMYNVYKTVENEVTPFGARKTYIYIQSMSMLVFTYLHNSFLQPHFYSENINEQEMSYDTHAPPDLDL